MVWSNPKDACTPLTNPNSNVPCVSVCISGDTLPLDVAVTNFDDMNIGIDASLAPIGCTFDDNGDLSGKVFLCKIIDEETKAITYENQFVSIAAGSTPVAYDEATHGAWGICDRDDNAPIELACAFLADTFNGKILSTESGIMHLGLDGVMTPYDITTHGVAGICQDKIDQVYTVPYKACFETPDGEVVLQGVQLNTQCLPATELVASVTCSTDPNNIIGKAVATIDPLWNRIPCDDCTLALSTDCVECA